MARRRRAVERASARQSIADRAVILVLVVVGASGLMSILPAQSQQVVARFACRVGSLGLGSCGASIVDLDNPQLNPPRCLLLATLDASLPEVRTSRITTADGLPVEISTARSGDAYVNVGSDDHSDLPLSLAGQTRTTRDALPGAQVPARAEWLLPGGQGVDAIVDAIHDNHRRWLQRRSSLAVLSVLLDSRGRDIPEPTTLFSQVQLDTNVLPHLPGATSTRPGQRPVPSRPGAQRPGSSSVAVVPSQPATLEFNRITRESSVIAGVKGVVGGAPVAGSVRWTRDSAGAVTSVLVAIVSAGQLVPGEAVSPKGLNAGSLKGGGTIGVAYIVVPFTSVAERNLAGAWLSDSQGFVLGLDELLGLKSPDPSDQLTSFLARAATVTILRYSGTDPVQATLRVSEQLTLLRRTEWPDAKLLTASEIAPQPDRAARVLSTDPTCSAP